LARARVDYNSLIGPLAARCGTSRQPGIAPADREDLHMKLPKIDISSLPDLDVLTGVFGSLKHFDPGLASSNDLIVVLMVYLYETMPLR